MRRPSNNAALGTNAAELLAEATNKKLGDSDLLPLLRIVCDVLDLAAGGEDIFLTVGKTRNKSALVVTVSWDGQKMFAAADNVLDLAKSVAGLLDE